VNPAQQLSLEFNSDEARLKHPQGDAALRLTGYGYGGRLRTPAQAKLMASGNRVEFRRGELSEWYVKRLEGGTRLQSAEDAHHAALHLALCRHSPRQRLVRLAIA
jgi:hypothetical protein